MKHLDRKYFRYRADVVARWQAQYPERAGILATSEILRLGFVFVGAALVALIAGVLTRTSIERVGLMDWRPYTFGMVALFSAWVTLRVFLSLVGRFQTE